MATDSAHDFKSREKIENEVGPRFAETAQRLRTRIGYRRGNVVGTLAAQR